jgi:NitT/TauT family transport system permease protein
MRQLFSFGMVSALGQIFTPNGHVTKHQERVLFAFWAIVALVLWYVIKIPFVPNPVDVIESLGNLWTVQGLATQAMTSFTLNLYALFWSTVISLVICYLYPVAFMRPFVTAASKGRFLGLTGLFVFFVLAFGSGSQVKLMMLIFGETVFFVTAMRDVVRDIPKEKFDHARTQGMSEWRVVYEVVVLGTFDKVFDIMRSNAAIGWTMLTMVEGISRADGGLGAMLLNGSKHFKLEELVAIQLTIVGIGVFQDFGIHWLKRTVCPYSELKLERR